MVSRRPRPNNSQHAPRAGANGGSSQGSSASDYGRASYGSGRPSRLASSRPSDSAVTTNDASASRPAVPPRHNELIAAAPTSDLTQFSRQSGNYGNGVSKKGVTRRSTKPPRKRMSKGTKIGIIVLLVLLLVLGGSVFGFYKFISSVDDELGGGKSEEEMLAIQDSLVARDADLNEPFYVLLLGSDARSNDAGMGERSDVAIAVRVDPSSNKATMISIPRDTKIVYKGSTMKFNAAYAYDGAAGSITAASDLLGVEFSHYAEVNFESLVELVDAVGGVEVDVPKRINDWKAGNITIEEGLQTLDGEAALVFARSRAYADGDFARSSNQRLLVEALINKVLSLPVDEIPGIVQVAAKCVTTDLTASDIFSLAMAFLDEDGDLTIYSSMVPSSLTMINGISYVVTDQAGLNAVMEAVEAGEDPSTVETYGITSSSLDEREEDQE